MKVYKFGGASVKDANGVRNLLNIVNELKIEQGVLVISAMGKMTNQFEKIISFYLEQNQIWKNLLEEAKYYHLQICNDLFLSKNVPIYGEVEQLFNELTQFFENNASSDYDFIYDQTVSKAELLSTKICSYFLQESKIKNTWLDIRNCIATNRDYRRAKVNWEKSESQIQKKIKVGTLYITQGFIAKDDLNHTTTLGREGSDYTAGILAYCLNAMEVSIFKDVPGVLNADPRVFKKTTLLQQISYKEAIEMAFYGASVIHPKTIQPLQRKNIPLYVKSFVHPQKTGTTVTKGAAIVPKTACFIVKKNQILLSLSAKDFSFMMEDDLSEVFDFFHQFKIKVNLIQNSAISFSVCIEDNFNNFDRLFQRLKLNYICLYNKNVSLYTIRHFDDKSIAQIENGKEILLQQLSRETMQMVTKDKV